MEKNNIVWKINKYNMEKYKYSMENIKYVI